MKLFRFVILLLLVVSLCSCSLRDRGTDEILSELMSEIEGLPSGAIYVSGAEEGSDGYLSPFMAEALYGEDASECFALVEDYSIYLSAYATPYEIAVFRCYSSTDAARVERLCRDRADIVSVALRSTEFYGLCQNIRIVKRGHTVVFAMTDEPENVLRLIKALI